MPNTNTLQLNLEPKEAYKLFKKATDFADALEEIMENHGSYSKEFLKGINLSVKQSRAGKLKKINSLRELK